jgi:hypothetical protein
LLREVAANGKRAWSIVAHQELVRLGFLKTTRISWPCRDCGQTIVFADSICPVTKVQHVLSQQVKTGSALPDRIMKEPQ